MHSKRHWPRLNLDEIYPTWLHKPYPRHRNNCTRVHISRNRYPKPNTIHSNWWISVVVSFIYVRFKSHKLVWFWCLILHRFAIRIFIHFSCNHPKSFSGVWSENSQIRWKFDFDSLFSKSISEIYLRTEPILWKWLFREGSILELWQNFTLIQFFLCKNFSVVMNKNWRGMDVEEW